MIKYSIHVLYAYSKTPLPFTWITVNEQTHSQQSLHRDTTRTIHQIDIYNIIHNSSCVVWCCKPSSVIYANDVEYILQETHGTHTHTHTHTYICALVCTFNRVMCHTIPEKCNANRCFLMPKRKISEFTQRQYKYKASR